MTLLRGRVRLLTPLFALVSVLAAGLFTADPASAAVVTPARAPAPACVSSVAVEVVVLQPENRVKGFSAAASTRTGLSASVSPDRVWVFAMFLRLSASGVTVYVNGDPVNLVDPSGHMAACDEGGGCGNGRDYDATNGGCGPSNCPVPISQAAASAMANNACNHDPGCREGAAYLPNPKALCSANMTCGEVAGVVEEDTNMQIAAQDACMSNSDNCGCFLCGITQFAWGTATSLYGATVPGVGPLVVQKLDQWVDADNNPWLAGTCHGWCAAGKLTGFGLTLIGPAAISKGAEILGSISSAADGGGLTPAVIGEGMDSRVIPYAQQNGYTYYSGLDNSDEYTAEELLAHNRAQIEAWMAEGRPIIDIGPQPGRSFYPMATSPNYAMEQNIVSGYGGYSTDLLPLDQDWRWARAN